MRRVLNTFLFLVSVECYSQEKFDTVRVIAEGINQSRSRLSEVVMKVNGEEKGIIFVKVDNFTTAPSFKEVCKYDSIVVMFTREKELFYFGIGEFIEIEEIDISRDNMRVAFKSKHHFNRPGPYNGYMIFTKYEENWSMKSLKLK